MRVSSRVGIQRQIASITPVVSPSSCIFPSWQVLLLDPDNIPAARDMAALRARRTAAARESAGIYRRMFPRPAAAATAAAAAAAPAGGRRRRRESGIDDFLRPPPEPR